MQLVESALPLLAPQGKLLYATCSLEPEENEDVVKQVLARHSGFELESAELAPSRAAKSRASPATNLIPGTAFMEPYWRGADSGRVLEMADPRVTIKAFPSDSSSVARHRASYRSLDSRG